MTDSASPGPNTVQFNLDIRFTTDDINALFLGGIEGRRSPYIPRYGKVVQALHHLYTEMRADNPFAENILIELDIRLAAQLRLAEKRIALCQREARTAEGEEGIVIRPLTRPHPYVHENVMTYNEYGRYLLRAYGRSDLAIRWIRTINGASHLESRLAEQWIRELLKRHRGLNAVILHYAKRLRHVTRREVIEGSEKARALSESLGRHVAPDVLSKARRCKFYRVNRFGAADMSAPTGSADISKNQSFSSIDDSEPTTQIRSHPH